MKTRVLFVSVFVIVATVWFLSSVGDAAKVTYEEIAVADGGAITGRVVWKGPSVSVPPMVINKNVDSCDKSGSGIRESVRLLVSKSGGTANAVVYLESIAKGKAMSKEALAIDQEGCRYNPHITIAPRKAKVTLKSSDDILHNIHMFGAANYNIPFPDKNSVLKTFRKAGLVRLQCDAGHGWMSAYVHVVNHPYYAVTDADGNFKLTDIPPGEYTLRMWHENWVVTNEVKKDGEVVGYEFGESIEKSQKVTVSAGAETEAQFTISK